MKKLIELRVLTVKHLKLYTESARIATNYSVMATECQFFLYRNIDIKRTGSIFSMEYIRLYARRASAIIKCSLNG